MILDEMKMRILHAAFINKNFIDGEEACNYENYLLELVNNSLYFREKSSFKKYEPPQSESNGECDCNSPTYELDFKLLESTTRFQASRELTNQIQLINKGVISHSSARRPNTEMTVTRLHAAIRNCSCEQLWKYLNNKYKYGTIENDISIYVKVLATRKNFLFLFPYQIYFNKHYNFRYALENINIALAKDFRESFVFRDKYCKEYDTFFSYIYDDNLIINKFEKEDELKTVDIVYLFKSETYRKLHDYMNY